MDFDNAFVPDGAAREVEISTANDPRAWYQIMEVIKAEADRWEYTVNGQAVVMSDDPLEWLARDGSARIFDWWVGATRFRVLFLDPDLFQFSFVPTPDPGDLSVIQRALTNLANRLGRTLFVRHDLGDVPEFKVEPYLG